MAAGGKADYALGIFKGCGLYSGKAAYSGSCEAYIEVVLQSLLQLSHNRG